MEDTVKWEEFINEHNINISDLPENVQHKIDKYEETFEQYQETDDENEENDLELSLKTMDNGILNDLESFIAKPKSDEPDPKADPAPKAADGGQTPPPTPATAAQTPPQHQASDKPSWAFWM
jgi:hypothetical protein